MTTAHISNPWGYNTADTFFDVDVTEVDGLRIAFVHERADNKGVSITNAAESVYTHVINLLGGDPRNIRVVEVYDESSYEGGRSLPDTYDLVTVEGVFTKDHFVRRARPAQWRRLGSTREEAIETLTTEGVPA